MRGLLIVVAAVAILLGTALRAPDLVAMPALTITLFGIPIALVVGLRRQYLVGYGRAFSIGALLAIALAVPISAYCVMRLVERDLELASLSVFERLTLALRLSALFLLGAAPLLGAACAALRWVQSLADVSLHNARQPLEHR